MLAIDKKNDAMATALLDHNADVDIQQNHVRQGPQGEDGYVRRMVCVLVGGMCRRGM